MDLTGLFKQMVELEASDLFLSVGAPAYASVEGKMRSLTEEKLTSEQVKTLAFSLLDEDKIEEFETTKELNAAIKVDQVGRFRVNLFRQMGEIAFVSRYIKDKIPSLDQLKLPEIFKSLILEERGLILVVGSTGTGKSTTLASMISHRNHTQGGHILTIEDPVEFVHQHEKSLVNQREVGVDTDSYEVALKNAMREAPDVIMIGEIRDGSTMKKAIAYAESGHLCLSTLHANSANEAIDRIMNFFEESAHKQLFNDLSTNLRAIISQRLPVGKSGRRVAAVEIMINTPLVSNLINRGEISKIKEAMSKKKGDGCQTFDDALFDLVRQGELSKDTALQHADSRNDLSLRFRLEGSVEIKVEPIKKEISFAKGLSFENYRSYKTVKFKIDKINANTADNLEGAIRQSLTGKGFSWDAEKPDLEIRYSLGLNQQGTMVVGALLVNVTDVKTQKSVWRAKGQRMLESHNLAEWDLGKDISDLLSNFPPDDYQL